MRISDCSSDVCSSDLRMVNAYAMLANQGRQLTPKLMDYVQDRRGKVIWPLRWRACDGCNMANWDGKPMPRFGFEGRQVMNPMTASLVVHKAGRASCRDRVGQSASIQVAPV